MALQKLGPLMKSARVNEMFQKHLKPEESLLYGDFLNDLCKLIVCLIFMHNCFVVGLFVIIALLLFVGSGFHRQS